MDNLILVDWLTFRFTHHSLDQVLSLSGLSSIPSWESMKSGFYGYRFGQMYEGIKVMWSDTNYDILIDMSGKGCRTYETFCSDCLHFICSMMSGGYGNFTRIDIAFDDHSGIFDLDLMRDMYDLGHFLCTMSWHSVTYGSPGTTFYFGSPKSDIRFRIYDKASELGHDGEHWVRFEIQIRKDYAQDTAVAIWYNMRDLACECIGSIFHKLVHSRLRFVVPSPDSNKSRWDDADFWEKFDTSTFFVKFLSRKKSDYNIHRLDNHLFHDNGGALFTLLSVYSPDVIRQKLDNMRPVRLHSKYQEILSHYGKNKDSIV